MLKKVNHDERETKQYGLRRQRKLTRKGDGVNVKKRKKEVNVIHVWCRSQVQ